jgi:hypothetical protein
MSEYLLTLLAFFIGFFAAFSVIELLIVFILNKLEKKHWEFVIDTLIRAKVHHGRAIEMIAIAGILIVLAVIWFLTPFFAVFGAAKPILKTFSFILLIVMVVIYFTTARKVVRLALERKVHQYIYFVISIIVFAFIVIMADQSYNAYQNYVHSQIVQPAVQTVQSTLDKNEETRLLAKFKEDYLAGRCEVVDYTSEEGVGVRHFVFVKTDIELASKQTVPSEIDFFKGYRCTDGENTFLLTDEGKWYWVISE